jgi:hypothetical protein
VAGLLEMLFSSIPFRSLGGMRSRRSLGDRRIRIRNDNLIF